jgi:hypothetical protein
MACRQVERRLNILSQKRVSTCRFSADSVEVTSNSRESKQKDVAMNTRRIILLPLASLLMHMSAVGQAAAFADDNPRKSVTAQGLVSQGGTASGIELSHDEHQALEASGQRSKPTRPTVQQKSAARVIASPNTDFWFYTADVELFDDRDRDGFYSGISLLFDADTYYEIADVYAVIYLSYEYGEWNEYAETETFTLFGASDEDEYIVETDLVAGYPTGSYDILIELYDAWDNAFVASFGPEDTSELAILPLEDAERDSPASVGTTRIVVSSGGGGSTGWLFLLALAGAAMRVRAR